MIIIKKPITMTSKAILNPFLEKYFSILIKMGFFLFCSLNSVFIVIFNSTPIYSLFLVNNHKSGILAITVPSLGGNNSYIIDGSELTPCSSLKD
jgi:hypothetical protein